MKLENFFFAIDVLKYVLTNPECTIPQLREFYGVDKENNLYKITSYLNKYGLISKINNTDMKPGGPHFFLKATQKGKKTILTFKELFSESTPQSSNLNEADLAIYNDFSTEFSKFSYEVLDGLLKGLLYELPKDSRLYLNANRAKIKGLIENSHSLLQQQFSKIIDSLI